MTKPEPSEVTWRGWFPPGPMKFLNSSASGESGGRSGMAPREGAFNVCEVVMFTTVGSSRAVSWAKEAGALGRGVTCAGAAPAAKVRPRERIKAGRMRMGRKGRDSGGTLERLLPDKQGEIASGRCLWANGTR